jgi:hypothetical protein
MASDDPLLCQREATGVNQFQWLLSVSTGKPSPGKPNKRLVHVFDSLHAGFTGSINDPALMARLLLQEPLETYGMTWQAQAVRLEYQLSQTVDNLTAPSLWDVLCGWEEPAIMGILQNQYLPPYARGYSFEVHYRTTLFLPEHRKIHWEALDKPCFGLLENAHSDPYVHGSASASSEPSNNSSAEPLPQHMTVQQLSDRLVQIFADSSKPLGSNDGPLSSRSKVVAMHARGQHHTTAHQVLDLTAEAGAQADIRENAVHSCGALNFEGLPSGKWFCSCGNPSRLIHDPADAITDALFSPGEVLVFDALEAQLDVSGIRSCANSVGSMFLDAATRSLTAMRMAVQV